MMSEDMSAYVYADTYASSQIDITTETPLVSTSIIEGFIVGKVHHEVGYVAAYMNTPVLGRAYTDTAVCASATSPYPEGDNIFSSVGDVARVSANISEDDRTGQYFVSVYNKFTCSAACYRGNDDY